jgi:hypothetical protein
MFAHPRPVLCVAFFVSLAAPASSEAQRRGCTPVDSTWSDFGTVLAECEVDKKAKVRGTLRINFNPSPSTSVQPCYKAVVEIVIDENGAPIVPSARVVRTTDTEYAKAVLEAVQAAKYYMAEKDKTPVKQLLVVDQSMMPMVRTSVGAVNSRATPMQRNPC